MGVVVDLPGKVTHHEVQPLSFGFDVVLGLDVVVELICEGDGKRSEWLIWEDLDLVCEVTLLALNIPPH